MSTQTIRTGSQDCSTKKKVSVLITNSLLHAVMSSIHCAGAGYFFLKATRRGGLLFFSPFAHPRDFFPNPKNQTSAFYAG